MALDGISQLLMTAEFGAFAVSSDKTISFWNQSAERILGYSADQVVGRRCCDVAESRGLTNGCQSYCLLGRDFFAGQTPRFLSVPMVRASGEEFMASLTAMTVSDAEYDDFVLFYIFNVSTESGVLDSVGDLAMGGQIGSTARADSDDLVVVADPTGAGRLTPRELEVLHLVALGWDTARIARELGVSEHTALNHIRNLRQKLNAQNKLEAVIIAVRLGILKWK